MRRLVRARPEIYIAQIEMLAIERKRPGLRPRLDDEIMRFVEAFVREVGIDAGRVIFGTDAAHEAANDPAAREIVEHRVFFGDEDRIVHDRQRAAQNRDLDLLGPLDERACDQVRRRHHAIGILMMLVDTDPIEAKPFAIDQKVDIGFVLVGAFDRIVKAVGQHHPGRAVLGRFIEIERTIRHQVKGDELHRATPFRNSRTCRLTMSAFSICGRWPHSGTMTIRASGSRSPQRAA